LFIINKGIVFYGVDIWLVVGTVYLVL